MRVPRLVRLFRHDTRGVVALEFAMVGLLVIGLVLETLQAGLFLYQQAELERATSIAARQIMVGTSGSSLQSATQFHDQVVCPLLPAGIACTNVMVDAEVVSQAAAPNGFYVFAKPDMTGLVAPPYAGAAAFCTGSSGSVVYLRVIYTAPAISPAWRIYAKTTGLTLNGGPAYRVASYAAFRNEPFQGGTAC